MIVRFCEVLNERNEKSFVFLLAFLWLLLMPTVGTAETIRLATTTSLEDSGLLRHLWENRVPTDLSDVKLQTIVVGSGAALEFARRGDVDLVIVHDRQSEERFIREGYGVKRLPWIRNDFVLLGPDKKFGSLTCPADILSTLTWLRLRSKQQGDIIFVSRGDQSGTHKREIALFAKARIKPSEVFGSRFLVTGQGMGTSLNIAMNKQAFILSDFGTWQNRSHQDSSMRIWCAGDSLLNNPYSVLVLAAQHGDPSSIKTKQEQIHRLLLWLFSKESRKLIENYTLHQKFVFTPHEEWSSLAEINQLFD